MAKKIAVCWVLFTTVFCGAVAASTTPSRTPRDQLLPEQFEQVTTPRAAEVPIVLARSERRERRREWRQEVRQEWRREVRQEWRRERRNDAVAAAAGGLIVGGVVGAAAASAQRRTYQQNIYNYPDVAAGYDYPYPPR